MASMLTVTELEFNIWRLEIRLRAPFSRNCEDYAISAECLAAAVTDKLLR